MNSLEFELDVPPPGSRSRFRALHRQLREAIRSGRLADGARLPATRDFAAQYGLSRNTVVALYDRLQREGLIEARRGSGTFVANAASGSTEIERVADAPIHLPWAGMKGSGELPPRPEGELEADFGIGFPDTSRLPLDIWRRLYARELRRLPASQTQYRRPHGEERFRVAVSRHLSYSRAVASSPDTIVATAGAQQAYDLIARTLVQPGKTLVALEDPGYPPMGAAFRFAGARIAPVPVDDHGIVVERIPRGTDIVCVTPSHQFPTGVVLSAQRRAELRDRIENEGLIVVEDDYDSEFRYGAKPLDALKTADIRDRVFYVGTFSKSLFPALRLGFLVSPRWALETIGQTKRISDWHSPTLSQLVLSAFIEDGHLSRHIRSMRRIYARRRACLIAALERRCGTALTLYPSAAGLHLGTRLSGIEAVSLAATLLERGIGIETFERYSLGPNRINGLLFGFGQCAEENISTGVDMIARTIGELSG
ncbi:PLP-dependent aminotransferase family protein [Pelagerythrobacter marensis]|uniref:PLP-dependent aminotransferase family protein n=1 Tax=Pelagerythrobacter marensis TaxID=543877 RepID=A0ABZ2DA91_9SPHN